MNYTMTDLVYSDVPTGTQVISVHPTSIVTLVPKPGYTLSAGDFSYGTSTYISGITFTQNGDNINAAIDFYPGFNMPGSNVNIPLCFSTGDAVLKNYNVSGSVVITISSNITSTPGAGVGIPFSNSGNLNTSAGVFTGTLTCASGYYMPVAPVLIQNTGQTSNFSITYNDTYAGALLTARQYTITYLYPNYDTSGNNFSISASAIQIYVPVIKITNYSTSNALLAAGGDIRTITVIGNAGANWVLTCASAIILQSDGITVGTTLSGTLGSTGTFDVQISVPPVIINTTYTVVISGDLLSPFPLPTNIVFNQNIDIDVTYTTSLSNLFINSGNVINTGTPQSAVVAGMSGYDNTINWNITPVFGMVLVKQPGVNAWSNLDPDLNNGTSFIMQSISATQVSGSLITINSVNTILRYGLQDMTTTLDLGSFIAHITTSVPTSITSNSVDIGSSVSYGGTGGAIGERGLCYSTAALPTVANTKLIQVAGFGVRDNTLTGLLPGTTYYVRGYAYNLSGSVFYGNQQTFTTTGGSPTACVLGWATSNLQVTAYTDGTPLVDASNVDNATWNALTVGAWTYPNGDEILGDYGRLYNWYAVAGIYDAASLANPSLRKTLAPTGTHVATIAEWDAAIACLGGVTVAGSKLKETGTTHWLTPNTDATNSSGFTALGAGYRTITGFAGFKTAGIFWAQEELSSTNARQYGVFNTGGGISIGSNPKYIGYSVRVKNN